MKKNYSIFKLILAFLIVVMLSTVTFSQVSFTMNPSNGCAPLAVNFTYSGINTANYFKWHFGDGDSSNVKNASHIFLTPGYYSVNLSVWDTTGGTMIYVGNSNGNVQVDGATDFTISSAHACPGEPVSFNFNQGMYNFISWNYGDGTQNNDYGCCPTHVFINAGTYNVVMSVSTVCGSQNITKQVVISNSAKPNFTINVNQPSACLNDMLQFNTQFQATSYSWAFGDSTTSTLAKPSHAYASAGNKKVILTATNSCGGANKDSLTINVTSVGLNANASFNMGPNPVCPNSIVNVNTMSSGTYEWDLGDGTTSTLSSISTFYPAAGNYNIRLILTNGCGNKDTVTQGLTVGGSSGMFNNISIGFNNSNGNNDTMNVCPGTTVELNNYGSWTGGQFSFLWKFGDGSTATTANATHNYTKTGIHKIVLVITNACGVSDSSEYKYVIVNPSMTSQSQLNSLPDTLCPGGKVYFFDDGNNTDGSGNVYSIDFGDGKSLTNITGHTDTVVGVLASHAYANLGTFKYKFYVTNLCGKKDSLIKDIIVSASGTKNPFYYVDNSTQGGGGGNNDNSACPGDAVKFIAVGGNSYAWNFGDGKSGTGQVTLHSYATPGQYTAFAIITNNCGQTDTVQTNVNVSTTNKPQADFTMSKSFACSTDTIYFMYNSNHGNDKPSGNTYLWDFGDSKTSTMSNPDHVYSAKGVYDVTLTVTNGCGSSIRNSQIIIDQPTVTITSLSPMYCSYNNAFFLTATPSGGSFEIDGASAISFNPSALITGAHIVNYMYTNSNGCSATESKTVTINNAIANAGADVSLCSGGNVQLNASGGTTYSWLPDSTLSDATIFNPIAFPIVSATYTLTVNNNGCVAYDEVQVTVTSSLTANAGSNGEVCNGSTVTLSGSGGGNYSWSPSANLDNATIANPTASPTSPTTYTLTVSSGLCTSTSTVAITVNPAVALTTTSTNATCNQSANGMAAVIASVGTSPYTYTWSNATTTSFASALAAGTYTVTTSDSKGCNGTKTVTINEPSAITTTSTVVNVSCNGSANGSASVTASGGSGTLVYSWSTGFVGQSAAGLVAGTYTITVKDANNCTTMTSVVVTEPSSINLITAAQDASCMLCANGTAAVFANGGTSPYNYLWTPGGQTSLSVNGMAVGMYTVCVTDANFCQSCTSVMIGAITGVAVAGKDAGIISIYPNPNDGSFVLTITELNSVAEFSVMDVTGKKIYSKSLNTKTFTETINLPAYANGIYFARLITNTGSVTVKRIVVSK